ncbi:MAG: 4Fe-4S binding protein [Candidatus Omnitrophota bacterium]
MAKRKIIKIDEKKCNGCGLCIPNCPEGAIQVINNKARLISDICCDGLGACIGYCPLGAITIEEREAKAYDEWQVMEQMIKQGEEVIKAHLKHLKEHNQESYLQQALNFLKEKNITVSIDDKNDNKACACSGSQSRDLSKRTASFSGTVTTGSQLRQWPIQLHLINPAAHYFKNADLLIAADCTPFTFSNFHERFLKGKILLICCPKLDQTKELYIEKLTQLFRDNAIKSITVVHMEVPCCFGLVNIVQEAVNQSQENMLIKEYNISIGGEIL